MKALSYYLTRAYRYYRFAVCTPLSYALLRFSGAKIGSGNLFDGMIRVVNQPGDTSIIIGSQCRFNSAAKSNLIGINKACILSTHLYKGKITIGDNCGFSGVSIGAFDAIHIGNNVQCGANSLITDSDWHLEDPRVGPPKPIVIRDNVWLGYGVIVLKGVEIGENTIIGANSVVTSNIPANVIAAGNPCKVIKEIKK